MNDLFFLHLDQSEIDRINNTNASNRSTSVKSIRTFLMNLASNQRTEFKTCLREIHFLSPGYLTPDQLDCLNLIKQENPNLIYESESAFYFLIELLCGLKSHIIGETEIFGQFKKFYDQLDSDQKIKFLPQSSMKFIVESVKSIRDTHVRHWGAHSYGSLIRKLIKGHLCIDVLGFGHLAQEIQPWIAEKKVVFHVRDLTKATHQAREKNLVVDLREHRDSDQFSDVVILAAPVTSDFCVKRILNAQLVIDCRALDERTTSVKQHCLCPVIELQDLFDSLDHERNKLDMQKNEVQRLIQNFIYEFYSRESHRPMGWYDLCL